MSMEGWSLGFGKGFFNVGVRIDKYMDERMNEEKWELVGFGYFLR